ncbi:hypothetical protein CEUSTIGMA_g10677.t1 [Chlamydomonas eustigma]|uniref:Calcineurin-like phosphoesterase domain-containing protein n=1 Tax=Chlamydomonas eustigma TaxID=1157962 RepID=A0A250XJI5_9CHLO|nr:hypothetical protein CEUSTIGMA_g10677.t1 [Chlamydomonas eustigma]|eukprot:GAX83251.1 hypothetical protein CEUSTIGMA_g10677.t1 [Chlamydomonas eustigma]
MQNNKLIFACCSDTHGLHTSAGLEIPVGDVLLFAGDAGLDSKQDIQAFETWLSLLPHAHKVVVMGNMDSAAAVPANAPGPSSKLHTQQKCIPLKYGQSVCDEIVEVAGYRIFGSPWTPAFYGQWQLQSEEAARVHWERLLPPDAQVDIIMTHGPPHGYGDRTKGRHVGDKALLKAVQSLKRPPLLWVCGHIHESVGSYRVPHPAAPGEGILLINAAANNIRLGDSSAAPRAVEITGREKAEVSSDAAAAANGRIQTYARKPWRINKRTSITKKF